LAAVANKNKIGAALAKLKYLVVIDPLATETSEFWRNFGEFNDVDPYISLWAQMQKAMAEQAQKEAIVKQNLAKAAQEFRIKSTAQRMAEESMGSTASAT
jgi:anaerobic selenocysteine-containing dehydrogenase